MPKPLRGACTLIDKPFRIFATCIPLPGELQVLVYRSTQIKDRHGVYKPVLDIVGDAEPINQEVVKDDLMVMGKAEILVYSVDTKSEAVAA